jgi:hypothetical protein
MDPIILFRRELEHAEEIGAANNHFKVVFNRNNPEIKNKLVIPRYSALPYYRELEEDLEFCGAKLINSVVQHRWIAEYYYYEQLAKFMPKSWDDNNFSYSNFQGPFVVKGKTNSRKNRWKQQMFAETREKASLVANELAVDSLIGEQGIVYKEYIPLKTFEYGINGLPFSNEFRFFILKDKIIDYGYYWLIAGDEAKKQAKLDNDAFKLIEGVIDIAKDFANFYVVDIAEKVNGGWIVVELNDGSQSGLSCIDEDRFYKKLHEAISDDSFKLI